MNESRTALKIHKNILLRRFLYKRVTKTIDSYINKVEVKMSIKTTYILRTNCRKKTKNKEESHETYTVG